MIKMVARTFHWPPSELSLLYLDAIDDEGLIFWYDDSVEQDQAMKKAMKKK